MSYNEVANHDASGISWFTWKGHDHSLKEVKMEIKEFGTYRALGITWLVRLFKEWNSAVVTEETLDVFMSKY